MSENDTYQTLANRVPIRTLASRAECDAARAMLDELDGQKLTAEQSRYAIDLMSVVDAFQDGDWPKPVSDTGCTKSQTPAQ